MCQLSSLSAPVKNALLVGLTKRMDKLYGKKGENLKLAPGQHGFHGRVTLDVHLDIAKAQEVWQTPTTSIPLKAVLAIALQKAGVQRENIRDVLVDAMTEAINLEEETAEELMGVTEDAMGRVSQTLKHLPKVPREGATTVRGDIEFLDIEMQSGVLRAVGAA